MRHPKFNKNSVEVECSVRVCDSVLLLIDALAGFQSQTRTVWRQAKRYKLPALLLVNKMDRAGAQDAQHRVHASCQYAMGSGTGAQSDDCNTQRVIAIQRPIYEAPEDQQIDDESQQTFVGCVNLVEMQRYKWKPSAFAGHSAAVAASSSAATANDGGKQYSTLAVESTDADYAQICADRMTMCEELADCDEEFGELYLNSADDPDLQKDGAFIALSPTVVQAALRRATLACRCVPLLYASAAHNTAVQPVLDAVCAYLPSPADRAVINARRCVDELQVQHEIWHNRPEQDHTVLYVFKVQHEMSLAKDDQPAQLQALCFARVYSGVLRARETLTNTSAAIRERHRALEATRAASDTQQNEVLQTSEAQNEDDDDSHAIDPQAASLLSYAQERILRVQQCSGEHRQSINQATAGQIVCLLGLKHAYAGDTLMRVNPKRKYDGPALVKPGTRVAPQLLPLIRLPSLLLPPPVYFVSLEPPDKNASSLQSALSALQREDPSVRVTYDAMHDVYLLQGMGSLHVEVSTRRLRDDYNIHCNVSEMRIAYKESFAGEDTACLAVNQTRSVTSTAPTSDEGDCCVVQLTVAQNDAELPDGQEAHQQVDRNNVIQISAHEPMSSKEAQQLCSQHILSEHQLLVAMQTQDKASIALSSVHKRAAKSCASSHSVTMNGVLRQAFESACRDALASGPIHGYPAMSMRVTMNHYYVTPHCTPLTLRGCVARLIRQLMHQESRHQLMEPVMSTIIHIPPDHCEKTVHTLEQFKRSRVTHVEMPNEDAHTGHQTEACILAECPLIELQSFTDDLRSQTSGQGSFSMQLLRYEPT